MFVFALFLSTNVEAQTENLRETPIVKVVQANRDAVVNITTTKLIPRRFAFYENDPYFNRPRRKIVERNVERQSLGSGFIVHPSGYMVTNAHVVEAADDIEILLANKKRYKAQVLSTDSEQDLAILKILAKPGDQFETVTLGDSSDLMPGEPAIAIGNPLGYGHSVTKGIISATARPLQVSETRQLNNIIQTDTSINPGSSGGPLLNIYGKVIGITTAMHGGAENIGFAISVNTLRGMVKELLNPAVLRGLEIPGEIVEQRTIKGPNSLHTSLSFVDKSGKEQFKIKKINGQAVSNIIDAYVAILHAADETLVFHDGQKEHKKSFQLTPAAKSKVYVNAVLGGQFRTLSEQDKKQMRLTGVSGILVEQVKENAAADNAHLAAGDVIIQIGKHRVRQLDALKAVIDAYAPNTVDLYVIRGGQIGRTKIKLEQINAQAKQFLEQ